MKTLSGREGASAPWDVMCPSQGSPEWGHGLHCPLTNTEDGLCSRARGLPAAGSPRPFSEAATASSGRNPAGPLYFFVEDQGWGSWRGRRG